MEPEQGVICNDCWQKLSLFPSEELKTKNIPQSLELVWPVFLFDDLFQKIVHALKYQGNVSLGRELGRRMADHLPPNFNDYRPVLFVPIPLHPIKFRERGYNQSEAIAQGLAMRLECAVEIHLLKRIKNTTTQTQLDAAERQVNMQAAFEINRKLKTVSEQTIILVDDVFTTGATLGSAAGTLRQVGFSRIIAVTAAAPL